MGAYFIDARTSYSVSLVSEEWIPPYAVIIVEGPFSEQLKKNKPIYDDRVSIPLGGSRPAIPAYPVVADDIQEASIRFITII